MRNVPDNVLKPDYYLNGRPKQSPSFIKIFNSNDEINRLRRSAKLAREMLEFAMSTAKPGMTTEGISVN